MTCGIYKITNKLNGNCYIGRSFNIEGRRSGHFGDLKRKKHTNPHLQADANQHGLEVFTFEILEEIDPKEDKLLCDRERFWVEQAQAGPGICYNIKTIDLGKARRGPYICDICGKGYKTDKWHLHPYERGLLAENKQP